MKGKLSHSLLWRTVLPILCIGLAFAIFLVYSLLPSVVAIISKRTDTLIEHSNSIAMSICEERFRNILDLRMESDSAMNDYSREESIRKIMAIADTFPDIHLVVLDNNSRVIGASFDYSEVVRDDFELLLDQLRQEGGYPRMTMLKRKAIQASYSYFPFWRWHIVSFIPEDIYFAPVNRMKFIALLGTFGTLATVVVSLIFVFLYQINEPLKRIITATRELRKGKFHYVEILGNSEIDQVAATFNDMVKKLAADQLRIDTILGDLQASEELYRILFEQAAVGVAITDSKSGKFVGVNEKYAEIVGYSREQLRAMSFQDISHPEDLKYDTDQLANLLEGSISEYSLDKRYFHQDGSVVWGSLTVSSMKELGKGDPLHIAILENITERKLLEEQLAEKNLLLEAVIMQSPSPIMIIRAEDRKLLYINQAAMELADIDRGSMGRQLHEMRLGVRFFKPDETEYPLEETALFRALKGVKTEGREAILQKKDGSRRWVLGYGAPIYNEHNKVVAALNIFPDITELKKSEVAIRESELRYRLIMEASPDPIVTFDMNNHVLYINPAFTTLFGWEPEELIGRSIPYVPEEAKEQEEKILEIMNKGEKYSGFATRRLDKEGNVIEVIMSWGGWRDSKNRLAGRVVMLRDVTREVTLKQQLLQAQKMESIGNLAGGIAHDFNNILSPIIGYSQLLLQKFSPDEIRYAQTKSILNAGLRASELVSQILAISRQTEQEKIPVKLQELIKEVIKLSKSTIPKNIKIKQKIQGDCSPVLGEPTKLHQVLMNLVTNAFHAVERTGGTITVELQQQEKCIGEDREFNTRDNECALLVVTDTGTGIATELQERIFDPYYTTKSKEKGTGLGLAIVYGIVKDHQGEIEIKSEVGKGTRFEIYLPVVSGVAEIEQRKITREIPTGEEHVLLVDDELEVLELGRDMLMQLGYRVTSFDNGPAALQELKKNFKNYDLVITDLTMPQMTGITLAKEISNYSDSIPIIICTGFGANLTREECHGANISLLLKKPLTLEILAKEIRQILDNVKK